MKVAIVSNGSSNSSVESTYVSLDDYRAHFNNPLAPSANAQPYSKDQREVQANTEPLNWAPLVWLFQTETNKQTE